MVLVRGVRGTDRYRCRAKFALLEFLYSFTAEHGGEGCTVIPALDHMQWPAPLCWEEIAISQWECPYPAHSRFVQALANACVYNVFLVLASSLAIALALSRSLFRLP
jgi:hypothetical protein